MQDIIIGIDAGTSFIKAVAFSLDGAQLDSAAVNNEYQLLEDGGAEQNMALTWQNTLTTLRELSARVPNLKKRLAAIAVTGQGDGTWLLDQQGEPVTQAMLWLDSRAAELAGEVSQSEAELHRFQLTGTGINGCQQSAQLMWLQQNRPEVLSATATALHCKDWLYYKLSGDLATDPSEGVFTFGNFRTRQYDDEVLAILGLSAQRSLLPAIVEGTQQYGTLGHAAAAACGLTAGTPVVLGYVDVICCALGSGLYAKEGDRGCSIVGSTGVHMRLARSVDAIKLNEDCTGYTISMPIPGVYTQLQSNMAATLNIDWLLDMAEALLSNLGVNKNRAELLTALDDWVAQTKPTSLLYQPYISAAGERGPFIDSNARAGFIGLRAQHGFNDMARAVFEGLSLAARDCYLAMGALPSELVVSGGAARSQQLLSILAAALESQIQTSQREEAGAAGVAMMAAVSIGHFSSMNDCVAQWVEPLMGARLLPDPLLVERYRSDYVAYAQSRAALQPVWQTLAQA